MDDLVARLDAIAERADSRLRAHPQPTADEAKALELVDPQALPFDPAAPDDSTADEMAEDRVLFRASLSELWASVVDRVK